MSEIEFKRKPKPIVWIESVNKGDREYHSEDGRYGIIEVDGYYLSVLYTNSTLANEKHWSDRSDDFLSAKIKCQIHLEQFLESYYA